MTLVFTYQVIDAFSIEAFFHHGIDFSYQTHQHDSRVVRSVESDGRSLCIAATTI